MNDSQPDYRKPVTKTRAQREEWFREQREKLRKREASEESHPEPW